MSLLLFIGGVLVFLPLYRKQSVPEIVIYVYPFLLYGLSSLFFEMSFCGSLYFLSSRQTCPFLSLSYLLFRLSPNHVPQFQTARKSERLHVAVRFSN